MFTAIYLGVQILILVRLISLGNEREKLLYWLAFLIPLNSVSVEVLTLWSWAKLALLVGIAARVLRRQGDISTNDTQKGVPLANYSFFLIYTVAVTFFWMFYDYAIGHRFLAAEQLGWGIMQSSLRYPVQLFSFLTQWGLVLVGLWFTKTENDLSAGIRGFVLGNLLNAFTGFYQVVAVVLGLPWFRGFWILRAEEFNPSIARVGLANIGSVSIPRLSGLGGEPKYAGANFVLSLFLLLVMAAYREQGKPVIKHYSLSIACLSLALVLTFSVGSWFAFLVALGYVAFVSLLQQNTRVIKTFLLLALLAGTLVGIVGVDLVQGTMDRYVGLKLSESVVSGYTDKTILDLLISTPSQFFFGRGAGGSDFWLLDVVAATGKPLSPAYVFTRFIAEQGIVGFLMLMILFVRWSLLTFRAGYVRYAHFLIGGLALVMMSHIMAIYGYLFLCGSILALSSSTSPESRKSDNVSHIRSGLVRQYGE